MNDWMRAARYERPERIPISISFLPATRAKYGAALNEVRARYPELCGEVEEAGYSYEALPRAYRTGKYLDAWGCEWENIAEGYNAIVTGHPLKTREQIRGLTPPEEDDGLPHGFMFLRLTDLRGFEEMMVDFAEEPPELQTLIDAVRDYNVRQARLMVEADAPDYKDCYFFGDDNGMQHALPISPRTWRKYLKPAYKAIYDVVHEAGAMVYMHTDGCIWEVIPDMAEAGVNVLNPQIRANGLDRLIQTCKGKLAINLDLDRQLFPVAPPEAIRDHIYECVRALYLPEGGLMLAAECAADVPLENIDMICKTLCECAEYRG